MSREAITALYHDMYQAMINKDEKALNHVLDDSFVLVHMTGMRQSKQAYIKAIMNGTLNYYSEETHHIDVSVVNDQGIITGQSKVLAAVFGSGRHMWNLTLACRVKHTSDGWKMTEAVASTW